jgi:hypothetical protein
MAKGADVIHDASMVFAIYIRKKPMTFSDGGIEPDGNQHSIMRVRYQSCLRMVLHLARNGRE